MDGETQASTETGDEPGHQGLDRVAGAHGAGPAVVQRWAALLGRGVLVLLGDHNIWLCAEPEFRSK